MITFLRRYLFLAFTFHLAWEFGHMPLYTAWVDQSFAQIILFGLHCTVGDVMIAAIALLVPILLLGQENWQTQYYQRLAVTAVVIGLLYTIYSEYYNVYIAGAWAYRPIMPLILGIGLTPLLQWLVVPSAIFYFLRPERMMPSSERQNP